MKSKRVKVKLKDDRISALPDHVLCDILSLLSTKDAARTSALSNRWKDLFASVPVIDCDAYNRRRRGAPESFVAFVNRVLYLIGLRFSHIRSFRLNLMWVTLETTIISSWISTAVSLNVQELDIYLDNSFVPLLLHLPLFSCKSLTVLKLDGCFILDVPDHVSLPSLNSFWLAKAIFHDDSSVRRLLSGCPVLEDLTFRLCDMKNIKVFHMSNPSIKRLQIFCNGAYAISFDVPNLEHLKIFSDGAVRCSGDTFKSLIEASIEFVLPINWDGTQTKMPDFVKKLYNARNLSLLGDVMQGLAHGLDSLPVFHALTHLKLSARSEEGWKLLPALLERGPCLETLILSGFRGNHCQVPLPQVPICFGMHLKIIHLNDFQGKEEEFTLVEYILAKAKVLDTVKLLPLYLPDKYFSMTSERLLASPTYSKTCRIAWGERFIC